MTSTLDRIDPATIADLPYVELLSLVRETNRPPGGKRRLAHLARVTGLSRPHRVVEIGSNTGFTSFELAKLCGCRVHGIDVSEAAVAEATRRLALHPPPVRDLVSFAVGDAAAIDAPDAHFDAVVCGGANSFIDDRRRPRALAEYRRVLRPYGFLAITNLFYESEPPEPLLDELSAVIGTRIEARGLRDWLSIFLDARWELFDLSRWPMAPRAKPVVDRYVDCLVGQSHLAGLDADARDALRTRWGRIVHLFNENHRHLGAMMLLLRPQLDGLEEQPELFLEPGSFDPFFELDVVADEADHPRERA